MRAKQLSLWAKIVATGYVLGMNIGYLLLAKKLPSIDEEWAIIQAGLFFALVFSPIDISIIITNLLGTRKKEL